jgi:hypothetical protein
MSEYQYYEFAAVDSPLDAHQLAEVRELSTRAQLTPTSFVNSYEWGDFRGDPRQLVEQYYDAFLYLANWGARRLMLRFPAGLLGLDVAQRHCASDEVSAWASGDHVIVSAMSDDEGGDEDWEDENQLESILPVRAEVLAGDLRPLYLLWLLGVQSGEVDPDEAEPPVPAGLQSLTEAQTALADFLRIDGDLIDEAAFVSAELQPGRPADIQAWVAGLTIGERDSLLVGLLRGDDPHLRVKTLRRMQPGPQAASGRRTAGQLIESAAAYRAEVERILRERREREAAEHARLAAESRRAALARLAAEGDAAWARVATRIAEKKPYAYDAAVGLLVDLQEVTEQAEFARRIGELKAEHQRKPALMERLVSAEL